MAQLLALITWVASLLTASYEPTPVPPTPYPTPTQAVQVEPVAADAVRAIVCTPSYAWSCDQAIAIVHCETGGTFDWSLVGAAGEVGGWQIHPIHGRGAIDHDPVISTAYAYQLWLNRGWADWACAVGAYP